MTAPHKQAVISRLSLTFISRHAMSLELLAKESAIFDVTNIPLQPQWFTVHHKEKPLPNGAKALLKILEFS